LGLSIKAVINLGKPETPEDPETPDIPTDPEEPELPDNPGTSTGVEEIPETGEVIDHQIGTYNIRYWNGENDSNNQGEIAWPNRKDKVFNFLCGNYGGAIFGLQEITSQMYQNLQIPGSTYYGYGRGNGQLNEKASGEQVGIFKNSGMYFQILRHGSFFYSTKEKSSFNRLCVWALVQSTINGKKFYIFNNHLAHDSVTVRKQQVETLLKKVEEIAGDNIVFIVGDFNLVDTEESYSLITAKYNDAYKLAENPQGGYNGTNHTYTGLYSATDNTSKRIDYIFTNLDTVESYVANNNNMGLKKYPSDHLPVVATFKF
jgi:endonuclease/exonuclease/phosphatase family metal-dependent hydrolase